MMSCIFDDNLLAGVFVLPLLDATMTHCVTANESGFFLMPCWHMDAYVRLDALVTHCVTILL